MVPAGSRAKLLEHDLKGKKDRLDQECGLCVFFLVCFDQCGGSRACFVGEERVYLGEG